jgi:hypothetical protein
MPELFYLPDDKINYPFPSINLCGIFLMANNFQKIRKKAHPLYMAIKNYSINIDLCGKKNLANITLGKEDKS